MDKKQHRALVALYGVDLFLETYAHRLPRTVQSGVYRTFRQTLAQLGDFAQRQAGSPIMSRGLTQLKDAKRQALVRDHIALIVSIAQLESDNVVELRAVRLPSGDPGIHKLIATARGLAQTVEPFRDVFVEAGLRPTFVEDLLAAADDVVDTMTQGRSSKGTGSGATAGIRSALTRAIKAKRALHRFIKSEAHADPALLMTWHSMKRVGSGPVRVKALPNVDVPPTRPLAPPPDALAQWNTRLLPSGPTLEAEPSAPLESLK